MRRQKLVQNLVVAVLLLLIVVFGALPILNRDQSFYDRFRREEPDRYDVVVIGLEPEGVAAALSAAKTGMRVLMVSSEPDPSSYLTDCLIQSMPHQTGIIAEKRVSLSGPAFTQLFGVSESTFASSDWLHGVHAMLDKEAGIEVSYESTLTQVRSEGRKVRAITVYQAGSGSRTIQGTVFIDATEAGLLLEQLKAPHLTGSEDLGLPELFEPVSFHFRIRGVDWEDIKTIAKVSNLSAEFSDALFLYPRTRQDVKLLAPSLIRQEEDAVVVSGLRLGFVNPGEPEELQEAWRNGLREAMHLTAYLQTELIPFADAEWDVPADRLLIPEHRHYLGMETLTVADILLNRDRTDKVAVLSDPVSANRFLRGDDPAVLCDPHAYAVPIGCLIPRDWDNVLMPGRNASYSSLASTSAATPSARVVVGEGAGLAAAWCVLEKTEPSAVPGMPTERHAEFVSFLERAGQLLPDFQEPVAQRDGELLNDAWMVEDVVALVSHGVLLGGVDNDFRLTENCSGEVLAVLAKNTLLRLAPDRYALDLDARLAPFATEEAVTRESAARLLLELAAVPPESGRTSSEQLFQWLERAGDWRPPPELASAWTVAGRQGNAQNGELYHLVMAVCGTLARQ